MLEQMIQRGVKITGLEQFSGRWDILIVGHQWNRTDILVRQYRCRLENVFEEVRCNE